MSHIASATSEVMVEAEWPHLVAAITRSSEPGGALQPHALRERRGARPRPGDQAATRHEHGL